MAQRASDVDDSVYAELFDVEKAAMRSGSGVVENPFPIWADLLARGPVHPGTVAQCMGLPADRGGGPNTTYYSVFSYAAASDVFTRKEDFGSEAYVEMGVADRLGDSILSMDGLRHRRYRDLIQPFFQPAYAESWWRDTVIAPLVEEFLDAFEDEDSIDLNAQFFARLPMHTMTSGFGLSPQQGIAFRGHMVRAFGYAGGRDDVEDQVKAAGAIVSEVARERRRKPVDDLISKLADADLAQDDGTTRKLTDEEIASFCRLILFAGGETTWRQTGIATFALLNHPEQMDEVRRDRALLQPAILESTRWNPDPFFTRKAKHDTVLHGVALPAGATLQLCLGAANRDPARWSDPDRYDIHRPLQRSLAFAAGAHSCLGQHVARQEIAAAIGALMDRFPNLRWDTAYPPAKLTGGIVHRGPGPLRVRLH